MVLKGKVVIAQGGGPTAVINQSLVGAALESRKFPQVEKNCETQKLGRESFAEIGNSPPSPCPSPGRRS